MLHKISNRKKYKTKICKIIEPKSGVLDFFPENTRKLPNVSPLSLGNIIPMYAPIERSKAGPITTVNTQHVNSRSTFYAK